LENESDHPPQSSAKGFNKPGSIPRSPIRSRGMVQRYSPPPQPGKWAQEIIIEVPLILSKNMLNTALGLNTTIQVLRNSHLLI
jgi:hypothetical protein